MRTWNRRSRNPVVKSESPGSRNVARGADSTRRPEAGSLHRGTGQSDVGPWRGRVPAASAEPRRRRRCRGPWCAASACGTRNAAQPGAQGPGAFWRHGGTRGGRLPPHGPRWPRGAVPGEEGRRAAPRGRWVGLPGASGEDRRPRGILQEELSRAGGGQARVPRLVARGWRQCWAEGESPLRLRA